jgi:hypothetical protein
MRKILALILIILSIILSGCSPAIFNLNSFVMPDDTEFMETIKELDTPLKITQYMYFNFDYKMQKYGVKTPYELWKVKKGDCNDFSNWVNFVGNYHDYETYQMRLIKEGINHWLGIFKIDGEYYYTDNQFFNSTPYNSLQELFDKYNIINKNIYTGYEIYKNNKMVKLWQQ